MESQYRAVRRSCQTMALYTGLPVNLSQSTTVSPTLSSPRQLICSGRMPAVSQATDTANRTLSQISSASCSTQPSWG